MDSGFGFVQKMKDHPNFILNLAAGNGFINHQFFEYHMFQRIQIGLGLNCMKVGEMIR